MTTSSEAVQAVRDRLVANKPADLSAFWFQDEPEDSNGNAALPGTPAPFAYVEHVIGRAFVAGYGGGRGANLYRNPLRIVIFVFVPIGSGPQIALGMAEQLAAILRSHRDSVVSLEAATTSPVGDGADLAPEGMRASLVNKYTCAAVEARGHFDQVG